MYIVVPRFLSRELGFSNDTAVCSSSAPSALVVVPFSLRPPVALSGLPRKKK